MEELLMFLCSIYPQSPECLDYLRKIIKYKKVRKDEFILREGDVCRNLYFIKKGALWCFYYVKDEAVSDWFFWENETVVAIGSFYDQVPSEEAIQALEDCELFYISFDELEYLYKHFIEFNVIGRVLTVKYLKVFHQHARMIRTTSAADRYQQLLKSQPAFIQRIPLGHLASWLNMSRETFSRKRGDID